MKQALIFAFFLTGFNFLGHAQTTHRISVADNLQARLDAATDGDIFLVEAGNYGDVNVRKRVTLIGNGYFLAETASASSSLLGFIKFLDGSEGSWITGFQTGDINVSVSNITIRRNHTGAIRLGIDEAVNTWNSIANNCSIQQNIGVGLEILARTAPGKVGSFICTNNIFSMGFHLEGVINGIVINNTFDSNIAGNEGGSQAFQSRGAYYGNVGCGKLNVILKIIL